MGTLRQITLFSITKKRNEMTLRNMNACGTAAEFLVTSNVPAEDAMSIILGTAVTGAKFTPLNHLQIGVPVLDRVCRGDDIPVSEYDLTQEACSLYFAGCRYFHYHARNFKTREQTTRNSVYSRVSHIVRLICPDMLISFGASRNGAEVLHNIANHGEWERVSQTELSLENGGGAHFVTMQAAIELQVICDLERKLGRRIDFRICKKRRVSG